MDICFAKYKEKQLNILVTVDHYSDFFEIDILKDLSGKSVVEVLKKQFSRYSIPELVCSDNGTHFVNQQFQEFQEKYNFIHRTSSPYHQQGNGKAEAAVKICKRIIKKSEESDEDFYFALLHHRNTPNKIGSSPVQRMFNRNTRTSLPSIAQQFLPNVIQHVPYKIEEQRNKSKKYYDKKSKELPSLNIGQKAYVQLRPDTEKTWSKGVVTEKFADQSYNVTVEGKTYRRSNTNVKPRFDNNEDNPVRGEYIQVQEDEMKDEVSRKEKQDEVRIEESLSPMLEAQDEVTRSDEVSKNKEVSRNNEVSNYPEVRSSPMKPKKAIDDSKGKNLEKIIRPTRSSRIPNRFKDYVMN